MIGYRRLDASFAYTYPCIQHGPTTCNIFFILSMRLLESSTRMLKCSETFCSFDGRWVIMPSVAEARHDCALSSEAYVIHRASERSSVNKSEHQERAATKKQHPRSAGSDGNSKVRDPRSDDKIRGKDP